MVSSLAEGQPLEDLEDGDHDLWEEPELMVQYGKLDPEKVKEARAKEFARLQDFDTFEVYSASAAWELINAGKAQFITIGPGSRT